MKPRIIHSARLSVPLATALAALLATPLAFAQLTWDANAATALQTDGGGAWLTANQWWNGTANVTWSSGSAAVFGNGGAGGAVTLASTTAISSLTFNAFTGTYTLGTAANTITLSSGITKNTGTGAATIISPITLGAAQSWTNNSVGLLTVGTGAVTNGGFLLTLGGTGNTTVTSVISGSGGLAKSDAGIVTLSGANTYGGVTTISGGVLAVSTLANGGATSAIGNSANAASNLVFASPTATLRHTGAASSTNRGFTLSSGAGGGATIEASGIGALSFDNTIAINYGTTNETRTLTLGGTNMDQNVFGKALSNNGTGVTSLVKNGAGTWVLNAANNYTGGSTVNTGSLVFRTLASKSGTGTHAFAAGTTLGLGVGGSNFTTTDVDNALSGTMTGNLSNVTVNATTNIGIDTAAGNLNYTTNIGSVSRGLTKLGTNTLTLSGSNAYTGVTTVVGGTLAVGTLANAGANSSIGNFATAGATGLALAGGTFSYTGASTMTDRGFTAIGSSQKIISVGAGVNLALGASVKNETASSTNGLTFTSTGAGSSITISSMTITAGSGADFNITGSLPTVTIQNLNVSGANVIAQRTGTSPLNVGNINGTGASGWLSDINVTGVISGYTGQLVLGGSNVTLSGPSTFDTSVAVQQAGTYTYNSIKNVGGGASALGAPTTVANGTIHIGNFTNIPTFKYVGTGDTTNRVLNLRGGATINLEQAGTGLLKFTGNSTADTGNTGAKTLNFTGSTSGTGEFSGAIVEHTTTNKTSVSKSGTGTWTLSGANTYTGTTAVNAGTLLVNNTTGSGTGTGAVTVAAGTVTGTPVAKLGGTGTVGGTLSLTAESAAGFKNGGVLAPTAAASGTALDVTGATTFNTGSIFEWNMSATAPATDPGVVANSGTYGQLAGTGAITGSGSVFSIVLGAGNAFTNNFWNSDKSWTNVFTGAGATTNLSSIFSSFSGAGVDSAGLVAGRGQFSFTTTSTLNWTAIPEPTSALAGLLLGAGLLRRRRYAKS